MEQRPLSGSALMQLLASFIILISIFLPWLDAAELEDFVDTNASFKNLCTFIAEEGRDLSFVSLVPWVVIITAIINIVVVFMKRIKLVSVLLFLGTLGIVAFFYAVMVGELHASHFIATGFYICIIGLILLLIGLFMKGNKSKYAGETSQPTQPAE